MYAERLAGSLLLLARIERGWTQRQLAAAAGVPVSTVARIETGVRQPSLVTLSRLLAAADLELRTRIEAYDDHDDILDARQAALSDAAREAAELARERTSGVLAAARLSMKADDSVR